MSALFGDTPLQLVTIDDDGRLSTVASTLKLVEAINDKNGIGAIVVAGPYHKGKSYLLNRMARTNNGFKVGLHTEAETKGIWVLARRIGKTTTLLIDSEGIDAPGNKATIDSRVFALGMLLSSVFIYNTMSLIEENSLRHLSFVTSLAEHINPQAEEHASIEFPHLLWLVRDFSYWKDLERKHGNSADQYMESVLSRSESAAAKEAASTATATATDADDEDADDNAQIRAGLSKLFPVSRRSCFLLPIPALDTEELVSMREEELNKKFVAKLDELVSQVLPALVKPKVQGNTLVSGKEYARLIELCVLAMNEEVEEVTLFIPNIRSKFALSEAESLYDRGMEFETKRFPLRDEQILEAHEKRAATALAHYEAKAYGPTKDELGKSLEARLKKKLERFTTLNSDMRDRSYLGFGSLQTAVVAGSIFFLLLALLDMASALLVIAAVVIIYYTGRFYTLTNRAAMAINSLLSVWEKHGKPWADEHPQAMIAVIVSLTLFLWWLS